MRRRASNTLFFFEEKQPPNASSSSRRRSRPPAPFHSSLTKEHLPSLWGGMHLNCEHPNEHHKGQEIIGDQEWHGNTDARPEKLAASPHTHTHMSARARQIKGLWTAVFTDQ